MFQALALRASVQGIKSFHERDERFHSTCAGSVWVCKYPVAEGLNQVTVLAQHLVDAGNEPVHMFRRGHIG
jgi:hypothetical protein